MLDVVLSCPGLLPRQLDITDYFYDYLLGQNTACEFSGYGNPLYRATKRHLTVKR